MTKLVAVAKGPSLSLLKTQITQAEDLADLIEIRLDLLDVEALEHLREIPRTRPLVFTLRKLAHGGACTLSEPERLALFEDLLALKPEYCDIETDTELAFFEKVKEKFPRMKVIGSMHDFAKGKEHPEELFERMQKKEIDHYKLAVQAYSVNDALKLMMWAGKHQNLTCIAMGEDGNISRILAPLIGSEFCYAAIAAGDEEAGQLTLNDLVKIYRFKTLTPDTKIYALLGSPVDQSIGHVFHNRTLPEGNVYVKLHLDIPELPLFFSLMREFPFRGLSITMPLKEQLGRCITRIASEEGGNSINTIAFEDAYLIGYNIDGIAALDVLEKRAPVKGKKMVLLGSGGTGRAIAYEAVRRGASVRALNRTFERAKLLSEELNCEAGRLEDPQLHLADIVVNTIPADLVFDPESLPDHAIVMDLVYWHKNTPLLSAAKKRGCTCIHGEEVFEAQAVLQQKIWSAAELP